MLKIYKTEHKELNEKDNFTKGCWISIVNPTNEEVSRIVDKFNVPMDFLLDALDTNEIPRIEMEDGKIFIVIRVPTPDVNNAETPFNTTSFGILIFNGYIMTIYKNEKFNVLEDLFNKKTKNINTEDTTKFLLKIFRKVAGIYLKYLKEINVITDELEEKFNKKVSNEWLSKLLNLEKSLIYFKTGLNSNKVVINKVKRLELIKQNDEYKDLVDDVLIENNQGMEIANIYSKVLDDMRSYFSSAISNNLNNRMKDLTVATIALMIPTLITSFFGMNVKLPFQNSSLTALYITIISLMLTIVGLIIFRKKY